MTKVRYLYPDPTAIPVFTVNKVYEVLEPDEFGVVCVDDTGCESVMYFTEYEVVENE